MDNLPSRCDGLMHQILSVRGEFNRVGRGLFDDIMQPSLPFSLVFQTMIIAMLFTNSLKSDNGLCDGVFQIPVSNSSPDTFRFV